MPWFFVKSGTECLVAFFVWDEFGQCTSVAEALTHLHTMTPLAQIGAIAAVALVIGSLSNTVKLLIDATINRT